MWTTAVSLNHEISGVIVDMDLVVNDCPRRYFVSGIVDAMAKNRNSALPWPI